MGIPSELSYQRSVRCDFVSFHGLCCSAQSSSLLLEMTLNYSLLTTLSTQGAQYIHDCSECSPMLNCCCFVSWHHNTSLHCISLHDTLPSPLSIPSVESRSRAADNKNCDYIGHDYKTKQMTIANLYWHFQEMFSTLSWT